MIIEISTPKGVIISCFDVHKYADVVRLNDARGGNFASLTSFWRFPKFSGKQFDAVRNYFGEDTAFFFHWFAFYTWQLFFPALVGGMLFFRR
jgi:hypothetical protein